MLPINVCEIAAGPAHMVARKHNIKKIIQNLNQSKMNTRLPSQIVTIEGEADVLFQLLLLIAVIDVKINC